VSKPLRAYSCQSCKKWDHATDDSAGFLLLLCPDCLAIRIKAGLEALQLANSKGQF